MLLEVEEDWKIYPWSMTRIIYQKKKKKKIIEELVIKH